MLAHLIKLFMPSPRKQQAMACYAELVEHARRPWAYTEGGVPDTLDGRFELILLHLYMLMEHLDQETRQALIEAFLEDMDRSVRELGVSDTGVGKRVRKMAEALYGRLAAYEEAAGDAERMAAALRRNLYGTIEPSAEAIAQMVGYVERTRAVLAAQDFSAGLPQSVRWE